MTHPAEPHGARGEDSEQQRATRPESTTSDQASAPKSAHPTEARLEAKKDTNPEAKKDTKKKA